MYEPQQKVKVLSISCCGQRVEAKKASHHGEGGDFILFKYGETSAYFQTVSSGRPSRCRTRLVTRKATEIVVLRMNQVSEGESCL